jgi:hypothetical protein
MSKLISDYIIVMCFLIGAWGGFLNESSILEFDLFSKELLDS